MSGIVGYLSLQHLPVDALHTGRAGRMNERGVARDLGVEAVPRFRESLPVEFFAPCALEALHDKPATEQHAPRPEAARAER